MDRCDPAPHELEKELNRLVKNGIKADRKHLKRDMCAQFSDPREWAREYVVNAYDANAKRCIISGFEKDGLQTILVEDDGDGMDRQRILDFFTLYRSVKDIDSLLAVGRHGIGKLSIAAIPGQTGFRIVSSNGKECWQAETGSLLDDDPLTLQQVSPVPKPGSQFYITFTRRNGLKEEMERLAAILFRYVRYLPLEIIVAIPESDKPGAPVHLQVVHDDWAGGAYSSGYGLNINNKHFSVYLTLSKHDHEIYQNRVFITNKYNLLCNDLSEPFVIPFLNIVVESPHFELPFGRHCLSNEEILPELSRKIRTELLPKFYTKLVNYYETGLLEELRIPAKEFEIFTCHLIANIPDTTRPWFFQSLFRLIDGKCLSFLELRDAVKEKGAVYIEDDKESGIDYSAIDAPVLKHDQLKEILELVFQIFDQRCRHLSSEDLILEAPLAKRDELSEDERNFEQHLGFHPAVLDGSLEDDILASLEEKTSGKKGNRNVESGISFTSGISEEAENASHELEKIRWRVNYLLQRDAKTPCKSRRYLFKDGTVVLNLNHPEIRDLVELSKKNPGLAGHWAVSICLADEHTILPHISAESREDLLLLDAMAKAGLGGPDPKTNSLRKVQYKRAMRDFLRNSDNSNYSLN